MRRGRYLERHFAAETVTRPPKRRKVGHLPCLFCPFSCSSALVSVGSPDRLPGVGVAQGRPQDIGRVKIGSCFRYASCFRLLPGRTKLIDCFRVGPS